MEHFLRLRPYPVESSAEEHERFYAVTHVIYTLNDYNVRRVAPRLVPGELDVIRRAFAKALKDADAEVVGESLDTLKALGFKDDPQVREGLEYLLSTQGPDGTWAAASENVYTRYHAAWTGIDGLRDYGWQGEVSALPWESGANGTPATR